MYSPTNNTPRWLTRLSANRAAMFVLALGLGLLVWQLLYWVLKLPPFILPSPGMVWKKFLETLANWFPPAWSRANQCRWWPSPRC